MIVLALEWWHRRCVRARTCKVAVPDLLLSKYVDKVIYRHEGSKYKPPPLTQSNFVVKTEVSAYSGNVFFSVQV